MSAPASAGPYRLYRDPARGWIAGVCAGIAEFQGMEPTLVRLVAVLGFVFFCVPVLVAYVVLALVLKPRPARPAASPAEEAFWRGVATDPQGALGGLARNLRALEARLGRMETVVTSEEFELRRGFRDLERPQDGTRP